MTQKVVCKINLILIALLVLSACASTPSRFPEYSETVKKHPSVAVIVDVFMYRDIAGKGRGVNEYVNKESLDTALSELKQILTERGFANKVLLASNGLTYEMDDGASYVVSDNWESTGVVYKGVAPDQADNPWFDESSKEFLKRIVKVASNINASAKRDQTSVEQKLADESESAFGELALNLKELELDPALFDDVESDMVLFVKVHGRFQKLGKFLSKGLLTGVASGVLTGGLVAVVPPGSYASADLVAFDPDSRNILWHGHAHGEGKNAVKYAIRSAVKAHPYSDGDSPRAKKRKRLNESQQPRRRSSKNRMEN